VADPLLAGFWFGARHGADPDHLAAIADLAAASGGGRAAFKLATVYAFAHGLMLTVLGIAAVAFGEVLPASVDGIFGKVIGATLIVLAGVVLWTSLTSEPTTARGFILGKIHRLPHHHRATEVRDAAAIGAVHGVGAETPTQIALLAAASAGEDMRIVLLAVLGLFITNSLVALGAAIGFRFTRGSWIYLALSLVSVIYSGWLGVTYLLGD
jgi:high-affinity nickel permease